MWPALAALAAVVLSVVGIRLVRRDRRRARRLRELTEELRRERERGARLTVTEERARVAHELGDVVAHQLSVISTEAAALDGDDPPARAIRRAAGEAMDAMRRALELLRGDEEAGRAPQPGLADVPALVAQARAGGMPVTLHVEGAPRDVPADLDVSAFRIVQEALANVHKHAGGPPATVRVAWRPDWLALYVRDTGARAVDADGDGHGLVGMRERVRALGG